MRRRIVIVGQKWLAAEIFAALADEVSAVVAPSPNDRLARAAAGRGVPVSLVKNGCIDADAAPGRHNLLIAAHAHWKVPAGLRHRCGLAIGYHPSLLPRHRGRDAIAAALAAGDRVTGGTVYELDDGWDTGPIIAQESCDIEPGETAARLWREKLGPMGLAMLLRLIGALT
jgi:methionyl-tRNA formyltransferase